MDEKSWVSSNVVPRIRERLQEVDSNLRVEAGTKLAYAHEIREYQHDKAKSDTVRYETDILVTEFKGDDHWKPRVIVEAKLARITTHDAITYSQKASAHKQVHPFLRYGILIGDRKHYPLPGRLFRHGAYFDFMQSWVGLLATEGELTGLMNLISKEVNASRNLEDVLYTSRGHNRKRYTVLHRPLVLM